MVGQIICSAEKVVWPWAVPSDIALSCKGFGKNVFVLFFSSPELVQGELLGYPDVCRTCGRPSTF